MEVPEYEYVIQGDYGYGWEDLIAEATRATGLVQLRLYREAEPRTPFRIIRRRETEGE